MMNPFGIGMPISCKDKLLYRQDIFHSLEERIESRKQTVILGVEGVGKSSLLQSFFCFDYRREKAEKDRILVSPVTEFPTSINADECYYHFIRMVISAVGILAHCDKKEEMKTILEEIEKCKAESVNAHNCFESTVNTISNNGYSVVMVIDNFERFTLSETITKDHHETLRKLLGSSQYIVATNYDLNKDTLPPDVSGSLFLMNFASNEIRLSGWSQNETQEFINSRLKGNLIQFNDTLIEFVHRTSGGIPMLVNLVAKYVYDYVCKHGDEYDIESKLTLCEEDVIQTLISHWCKMISPSQAEAIRKLIKDEAQNSGDEANLRTLQNRGILNFKTVIDAYGRKRVDDTDYEFCCELVRTFCEDSSKLDEAMEKNPFDFCDDIEKLKKRILKHPFNPNKPYVFISYSHINSKEVYEDVCKLKENYNCWIDFENLDGGRLQGEDDWTEKVKPVLENPNCLGLIMYISKEGFSSNGLMWEAEWLSNHNLNFYTFWIGFSKTTTQEEMATIIYCSISDDDYRCKMRKIKAFSNIGQIDKDYTEFSYYHRQDAFLHLSSLDFNNWLKKIKLF